MGDCINSILKQDIEDINIEILCIDDFSTDGTYEELIRLSKKHKLIRIIRNNKNIGVSATRNRLISESKGKYIWFVDPDDLLYPGAVSLLFNATNYHQSEVTLANYLKFTKLEQIKVEHTEWNAHIVENDYLPFDEESGRKMCAVWAGIFLRKFLIENELQFQEQMIAQEDTLFYYEFGLRVNKVVKCDFPCYLYRIRSTSIMHSRSEERAKKYYKSMLVMYQVYKKHLISGDYNDELVLKNKIHHTQQNIAFCLAMLQDYSFVYKEIKRLKKKGVYPYRLRYDALHTKEPIIRRLCNFLLPFEPVFWLLHYIYSSVNRVKYKRNIT